VQEGRLFLPMTKNGKSRSVLLNAKAKEVIAGLRERKEQMPLTRDSRYLFPSRDGSRKKHIIDLRVPFEKVCEAADIEGLRIHDLRHSFATIAIMSGATLYDVQKLLGHANIAMTQRYAHMVDDNLQRATDNVAGVIEGANPVAEQAHAEEVATAEAIGR
jgi:site-specific recombinase XerD